MGQWVWHRNCTVSNAGVNHHPDEGGPRRFANGAVGSFSG